MALNHSASTPSFNLLIDEAYLKFTTDLNQDVDFGLVRPYIAVSQDLHLVPICGSGILETVKSMSAGIIPWTPLLQRLTNQFLMPALAWWSMAEFMMPLSFRKANKGIEVKTSENSKSATLDEITANSDHYEKFAQYYSQRGSQFLKENVDQAEFEPYINPANGGLDGIYPASSSYFSGIYTPSTRRWGTGLGALSFGFPLPVDNQ